MTDREPTKRRHDFSLFGDEHVRRYRETDGEVGGIWNGAACCILTTSRSSGAHRDTPLIYGRDGDSIVLVASAGGSPTDPWWYRDLVREPTVRVQVLADHWRAVARTASGAEKERLWSQMAAIWPDYDSYRHKTERDIPVVVLDPVG